MNYDNQWLTANEVLADRVVSLIRWGEQRGFSWNIIFSCGDIFYYVLHFYFFILKQFCNHKSKMQYWIAINILFVVKIVLYPIKRTNFLCTKNLMRYYVIIMSGVEGVLKSKQNSQNISEINHFML